MKNFQLDSIKENEMDAIELSEAEMQDLAGGGFTGIAGCSVNRDPSRLAICPSFDPLCD